MFALVYTYIAMNLHRTKENCFKLLLGAKNVSFLRKPKKVIYLSKISSDIYRPNTGFVQIKSILCDAHSRPEHVEDSARRLLFPNSDKHIENELSKPNDQRTDTVIDFRTEVYQKRRIHGKLVCSKSLLNSHQFAK